MKERIKNIKRDINWLFYELDMNDDQAEMIKNIEKDVMQALSIHVVSNQRELLCAFFKYFRDNGENYIGDSIEQFVDRFLSAQ